MRDSGDVFFLFVCFVLTMFVQILILKVSTHGLEKRPVAALERIEKVNLSLPWATKRRRRKENRKRKDGNSRSEKRGDSPGRKWQHNLLSRLFLSYGELQATKPRPRDILTLLHTDKQALIQT